MARIALVSALTQMARLDGPWVRCREAGCDAYFGGFRSDTWLVAKFADHAARKHGAARPAVQGARPQRRRAAQVQGAPAGLLAVITAFVDAHVGGAQRLGRGVSREVFPFGPDHVIKIAHDPAEGHNAAEAKAYAEAPAAMRRLLAPVVAVDPAGVWLLMRKATRVGEVGWQDCDRLQAALHHKIGDLHPANVGWLDGHWVAIDYAGGWAAREVRW